ncbi:MAG: hypothetical protein ABJE95_36955 [Byssovorax sp.]
MASNWKWIGASLALAVSACGARTTLSSGESVATTVGTTGAGGGPSSSSSTSAATGGGQSTGGGSLCGDGPNLLVATAPNTLIALDELNVYWIDLPPAAIRRVPKHGGAAVVVQASVDPPGGLAVDGSNVYWLEANSGVVRAAPKAGGGSTILTQGPPSGGSSWLAVDATSVVWTVNQPGQVFSTSKQSGGLDLLASAAGFEGVALDNDHAYTFARSPGLAPEHLIAVPRAGGPTILLGEAGNAFSLVLDTATVYWADGGKGAIVKAPKGGGGPEVELSSGESYPFEIAIDEAHVYWTTDGGGEVVKMHKGGGPRVVIASDQPGPTAIAVDEACVYWLTSAGVMRAPK